VAEVKQHTIGKTGENRDSLNCAIFPESFPVLPSIMKHTQRRYLASPPKNPDPERQFEIAKVIRSVAGLTRRKSRSDTVNALLCYSHGRILIP
jgi:hypothetical protein